MRYKLRSKKSRETKILVHTKRTIVTIAVALVEPLYHINVGHVSRLMKNFGLSQLYFVNPHFDSNEAVKYSTHGKNILARAKEVATIQQLRRRFDLLIGTTAISASSRLNVLRARTPPEEMANIINKAGGSKKVCILLGRESSGLNNKELELCDFVVTIDTKTNYRTMNIAHALAIILYEMSKLKKTRQGPSSKKRIDSASKDDVELLMSYVRKVADKSGYDNHKKALLYNSIKRILGKSSPNVKDVMLMVSLFRRTLLAIERSELKLGQAVKGSK